MTWTDWIVEGMTKPMCRAPGCESRAVEAIQVYYERGRGPRWPFCRPHAEQAIEKLQRERPDLPVHNRSVTSI